METEREIERVAFGGRSRFLAREDNSSPSGSSVLCSKSIALSGERPPSISPSLSLFPSSGTYDDICVGFAPSINSVIALERERGRER